MKKLFSDAEVELTVISASDILLFSPSTEGGILNEDNSGSRWQDD